MRDNSKAVLPRILIYQNENYDTLISYLRVSGFNVAVSTEDEILDRVRERNYDLCILDHYRKPNAFGQIEPLKPLKVLRKSNIRTPALILSSKHQYNHIIEAFDGGADDYVVKPYCLDELVRRIKAILKRCGIFVRAIEPIYTLGSYVFDTNEATVIVDNTKVKLTPRQSQVLALLCSHRGEVLPKKVITQQLWMGDTHFNRRSLDVYVCRLRDLFKSDNRVCIETIRRIGYVLTVEGDGE